MVAKRKKYDVIDAETGALDRRIFVDQDIYEEEVEKIFGHAWQMVAHVSLIPKPNDFFLSYIGQDPVIVTRDDKGEIHVLLNVCRHRGNRVVCADDGNAKSFMCTCHGWTFDNDGCLNHVPGEQEAYYGELNKDELGLIEAKADTYAGIIFATWDHDAPSLEDYLGDARWYLDTEYNRNNAGTIAVGPQKWLEPRNWKTAVDNCSDNYHVPITHFSSMRARNQLMDEPMFTMEEQLAHPNPNYHAFVNGHSITFGTSGLSYADYFAPRGKDAGRLTQESKAFRESKVPEIEKRLGADRGKRIRLLNHSVFPNRVLGFRLALPRGPLKTEFWHFWVVEADTPPEILRAMMVGSAGQNGAAGVFEQDDMDNWGQVTEAGLSATARKYPQMLALGAGGHAHRSEEWPGLVADRYISELNQRHFYLRWQEFMNADGWRDISLEPISVKFEGTAGMHI